MKIRISFVFLILTVACSANSTSVGNTKISQVLLGPGFDKKVFVALSAKPSQATPCNTNGNYTYVFDGTTEVGKNLLSVALAAYASKSSVKIGGYDTCNMYSNVEDLRYINIQ